MADIVSTRQAHAYHRASQLPEQVWHALSENQAAANVVLPFAQKAQSFAPETHPEQLWVVLSDDANNVEFVLSCTEGPMGKYPVFIVASKSVAKRIEQEGGDEMLADAMSALILCLLHEVPPHRVFSVFSIAKVSHAFAELFVTAAHARQEHAVQVDKIYYDAIFTFCTPETFNESLTPRTPGDENLTIAIRLADQSHVEAVKDLCQAFSKTSPPYVLDDTRAQLEAETMIENKQVWVHLGQRGSAEPEVVCLVATTRESDEVTAVTKVFTADGWRSRGCAERLLHRVCHDVLRTKKRVVLYVGRELMSARKLYHRIGFQGFQDDGSDTRQRVEGVDRWVEIGFKGTELGYW